MLFRSGQAEEAKAAIESSRDFASAAKAQGLDPKEAALARGEPLPEAGRVPELEEAAFSLAVGGTSVPLRTPAGYVVLKVVDRLPAGVPPLAEIKDRVAEAVKRSKAEVQALERATALAQAAERGEDLLVLAKKEGLPSGDTGLFSRSEPPRDGRLTGEVMRAAMELADGKVSQPVKSRPGVFVVKVIERQPPDRAGFDKERDELARQLLERKRTQAWSEWVSNLRAAAKIELSSQVASAR